MRIEITDSEGAATGWDTDAVLVVYRDGEGQWQFFTRGQLPSIDPKLIQLLLLRLLHK